MAVVFISPKQKQKMFLMGIIGGFLVLLLVIALGVFLSKPEETDVQVAFNKPKVNINLELLDSTSFKNLEPFTEIDIQYSYRATTVKGVEVQGKISAISLEEAKKKIEDMELTPVEIKEVKVGRDNPFVPYYQAATATPTKTTTTK